MAMGEVFSVPSLPINAPLPFLSPPPSQLPPSNSMRFLIWSSLEPIIMKTKSQILKCSTPFPHYTPPLIEEQFDEK